MSDVLTVAGLAAGYGEAAILHDIGFSLAEGRSLALLGRNGVGKTTLINSLIGVTRRTGGRILLAGQDVTGFSPERRALAGIGWVPQERNIFKSLTVLENLTAVARPGPWTPERVFEMFPRLKERIGNMGDQLSGGEQQMLAIGRALVLNPKVLLLDEPTEGLAPIIVEELLKALKRIFREEGMAGIVVEQHAQKILKMTDEAIILERGRIIHASTSQALIDDPDTLQLCLGVSHRDPKPAAPAIVSAAAAKTAKRRPAFRLPALTCDAHCHIFGPTSRFPYAEDRRYSPEESPKEALAALHARLGVSRAVVVQTTAHGTDNSVILDCLAAAPVSTRGVAILDDTVSDKELGQLHAAGVRGVRFNFVHHLGGAPDKQVFERVIQRIAPLGWHVALHVDAVDLVELTPMIAALPLPASIDHMGRIMARNGVDHPDFQALLRLAAFDHCWFKISGLERAAPGDFAAATPFAKALMTAAPDRVIWGTDFPHPNLTFPIDEADLVDLLPQIGDEAALTRLLVANPARLYGFD